MHRPLLQFMFSFFIIISLILLIAPKSAFANDGNYSSCSTRFRCGNIDTGYPFWGLERPEDCGYPGFWLNCSDDVPEITIMSVTYQVLDIESGTRNLRLARTDYSEDVCVQYLRNTTLTTGVFEYNSNTQNMTLYYGCRPLANIPTLPKGLSSQFQCEINETGNVGYYVTRNITESSFGELANLISTSLGSCNDSVTVPVLKSEVEVVEDNRTTESLIKALKVGFELRWFANDSFCDSCIGSGGQCGYNQDSREFLCYCSGGSYLSTCPQDPSQQCQPKIVKGQNPHPPPPYYQVPSRTLPPPQPSPMQPFPSTHFFFLLLLFLHPTTPSPPPNNTTFRNCNQTISCGPIPNLTYPFTGGPRPEYCGPPGFQLTCSNNTTLELLTDSVSYRVIQLDPRTQIMTLSRSDLYNNPIPCMQNFTNTTLDSTIFTPTSNNENLTFFYGCYSLNTSSYKPPNMFTCNNSGAYYVVGPVPVDPAFKVIQCNVSVTVPVLRSAANELVRNRSLLGEVLMEGFSVNYSIPYDDECAKCLDSGGDCGWFSSRAICICGDRICDTTAEKKTDVSLITGLGIAGAVIAGILLGMGFLCLRQRRQKLAAQAKSRDLPTPPSSKGPPTSTTSVLNDGRVVAVKRLYESNFKRAEQYMNEIEILTRIRHPNLVTLYGCTSRRSRELLLVYEYIPNGTVADHLHGKLSNSGLLTWPVRLSIAVETANALAYLHAAPIIHRDVKTNNILLDKNFHVKVADFGLSRLFPDNVTHVSTAPQGTPGYVDPEYYQCYQLTEKSDVYSFGVVLIELISSKQAVDTNRHRLDINLANMAVSRIQNHALHELVDPSLGFEDDYAVKTRMTGVAELAFRCLQQERDVRPSMEEVLETLRGIRDEELAVQKAEVVDIRSEAEVVDIRSDDVGLLKHIPPPLSPDSINDKWVSSSTITPPNSF
ncbi:hypothetical protein POUND7_020060 [Theobroma cacao]